MRKAAKFKLFWLEVILSSCLRINFLLMEMNELKLHSLLCSKKNNNVGPCKVRILHSLVVYWHIILPSKFEQNPSP
jgi:hypothetical protein